MLRVYGMRESGNCYKLYLLLRLLRREFEWIEVDILQGASRRPEFLAINPNGRVPVLEVSPGRYLPESNAALYYLAEGTPYLPQDRLERAQVLQWLFFEQYSHEPFIATSRYYRHILRQPEKFARQLAEKHAPGHAALAVMERHLTEREYFVGESGGHYSIADIGLYAYTHVADEGGFDLAGYPALRRWLARVAAQPGHAGMRD